ncbi:hypothetical protein CEXT_299821 [Caerostris extrusa]|uniref:Uncharacterized protein n=1 Tax=Caerostris extrusa TaxID=172846 RepID=A0AAV4V6U8_CAEEX|nr:hypothetical protein CEXT_299821 [Caerostris extrusa]
MLAHSSEMFLSQHSSRYAIVFVKQRDATSEMLLVHLIMDDLFSTTSHGGITHDALFQCDTNAVSDTLTEYCWYKITKHKRVLTIGRFYRFRISDDPSESLSLFASENETKISFPA